MVLALFGACVLYGVLSQLGDAAGPSRPYVVGLLVFGLIVLVSGIRLALRRVGFDFDRRRGTLVTRASYSVYWRQRNYELDRFDGLLLTRYWLFNRVGSGETSRYYYRLAVRAADADQANVELGHTLAEENARDVAGRLGDFLGLAVEEVKGRAEGIVAGR
ncbi:MAG: hypothetical protein JXO22_00145 [Phycisphaerae bacterium]|nr:hypothetical protein [Phycisphaerae bacterium]